MKNQQRISRSLRRIQKRREASHVRLRVQVTQHSRPCFNQMFCFNQKLEEIMGKLTFLSYVLLKVQEFLL